MNNKGYRGFSNYETWCVYQWIVTHRATYTYWAELTRALQIDFPADPAESQRLLAEQLERELESDQPELGSSLYAEMLQAALEAVNWTEVAAHLLAGTVN